MAMVATLRKWLLTAFTVLGIVSGALAQPPSSAPEIPPSDIQIGRSAFSLGDGKAINFFQGWREVAVLECWRALERRAAGALEDRGGEQTESAVRLLRLLRPSEQKTADLLCKNLTFVPDLTRGVHWTECYVSAMTLIEIGGPQVANSVINYLKEPRTDVELQLCAQILYRNDSREITLTRFRMATEEARLKMEPSRRDLFERHLSQIREWITDPRFGFDPRLLPALRP